MISGPIVKEVLNIDMGDLSTLKIDPCIPAGKDGIIAALIIAALGTSLDENTESLITSVLKLENLSKIATVVLSSPV